MQFPESWLREFCNPALTTQQLADTLTMAGLEVEELEPVAPAFTHIVVGEIKEAVQHPNADRLRVCQVDVGQGPLLNIVCGAPNARAGLKVVLASVGTTMPDGALTIKKGVIRGVESNGMLVSERELGLSDEHHGIIEMPEDAPVGASYAALMGLDDPVIEIALTPDRADCAGVRGIAREDQIAGRGAARHARQRDLDLPQPGRFGVFFEQMQVRGDVAGQIPEAVGLGDTDGIGLGPCGGGGAEQQQGREEVADAHDFAMARRFHSSHGRSTSPSLALVAATASLLFRYSGLPSFNASA